MHAHAEMESIFTAVLHQVLVSADTSSFKGFTGKLFILVREHMDAEREFIHADLLLTQVVDSDLGVGDTTTETGLGVRLVLTITVAIQYIT